MLHSTSDHRKKRAIQRAPRRGQLLRDHVAWLALFDQSRNRTHLPFRAAKATGKRAHVVGG